MKQVMEQFGFEALAGAAFIGAVLAVLIPVAVRKGPGTAIRALFGLVAVLAVAAGVTTGLALSQPAHSTAAVCHFDGGGTITAGNAARTSEGTVWQCTEDGRLVRIG